MSKSDLNISFTIIDRKALDLQFICRTCLRRDVDLLTIDSEVLDISLKISSLLESCIAVKVDKTDDLPKQVCSECLSELIKIHYFKNKCHQNENILKLMFTKNKTESKAVEVEAETSAKDIDRDEQSGLEGVDNPFVITVKSEIDLENKVINVDDAGRVTVLTNTSVQIIDDPVPKISDKQLLSVIQLEHHYSRPLSDEGQIINKNENDEVELFKCKICHMNCTSKKLLMEHAKRYKHSQSEVTKPGTKHIPKKKHICEKCGAKFYRGTTLRRHIARHAGNKPHICDVCGKGFTTAAFMNKHREVHNKKVQLTNIKISPPYICEICSCQYKSLHFYKIHVSKKHKTTDSKSNDNNEQMKKAKKSNDNRCEFCNKTFVSKCALRQHGLAHGEKNFLCATCGKAFYFKQTLNNHFRVHTGERPFKCRICSKSFIMYSGYESHMRIHTGQKPYTCTVCSKKFGRRQHLSAHMKTHTGEKLHQCTICERSFAQKFNLTVHMRIHTGDTPYKCPKCDKGFIDSGRRRRHCMNRHGLELERIKVPVPVLPLNK